MNTISFGLKAIDPDLMRVVKALNELIANSNINEDLNRELKIRIAKLEADFKKYKFLRREYGS